MITHRHKPYTSQQWEVFKIYNPKYSKKTVLLQEKRINRHNLIEFTRDPQLEGHKLYISRKNAKQSPINMMRNREGGTSKMREIPLEKLEQLNYWEEIF